MSKRFASPCNRFTDRMIIAAVGNGPVRRDWALADRPEVRRAKQTAKFVVLSSLGETTHAEGTETESKPASGERIDI